MATIDLRADREDILFDRGKTIVLIRYFLDENAGAINMTGWKARMMAKESYTSTTPLAGWDFTTETTGLEIYTQASETIIVPAGETIGGVVLATDTSYTIANPYGIKLTVSDTITENSPWEVAVYDIELIDPTGRVYPFLKGKLKPSAEVTV